MSKFKRYYLLKKVVKKRKIFFNTEKGTRIQRYLILVKYNLLKNNFLDFVDIYNYPLLLLTLNKHRNFPLLKNNCLLTGRNRSIYQDFRLSRMQLRHMGSFGYLMGVKKSSW
jgi:small subunit ribosomal protein S14